MKVRSELLSSPLSAHHLNEYCDHGVCIIADAAHSMHPLAGQRINLGISDAMILALVFPNMIGLFILFPKVKEELAKYVAAINGKN